MTRLAYQVAVVSGQWSVNRLMWGQPPPAVHRAQLDGFCLSLVIVSSFSQEYCVRELYRSFIRNSYEEDVMRAYLAKLSPKARILLAVPVIVTAYVLVTMVVPAVIHAVVPEVVRSVLRLL